ncbi:MAG TPA: hypothetical protein VFA70_08945 [Dehalococcoidia bacterium]|nr:hypothetical protein [Dehalococcoidia bacterium]
MGWGILAVSVLGLFIAFVILQETFMQRHWRDLVQRGDTWAIRTLVEQEIERWRGMRVPKGVDAALWHGIQTAEVASVGRDFINIICSAEGEYRIVGGVRQEVSSPLDEGMKLAAALLERLLYDIPNVRLYQVRVDVYTTFRSEDGTPEQKCILTTCAERPEAEHLPWDELRASEILARFDTRYQLNQRGAALPIDPGPVLAEDEEPLQAETPTGGESPAASLNQEAQEAGQPAQAAEAPLPQPKESEVSAQIGGRSLQ